MHLTFVHQNDAFWHVEDQDDIGSYGKGSATDQMIYWRSSHGDTSTVPPHHLSLAILITFYCSLTTINSIHGHFHETMITARKKSSYPPVHFLCGSSLNGPPQMVNLADAESLITSYKSNRANFLA